MIDAILRDKAAQAMYDSDVFSAPQPSNQPVWQSLDAEWKAMYFRRVDSISPLLTRALSAEEALKKYGWLLQVHRGVRMSALTDRLLAELTEQFPTVDPETFRRWLDTTLRALAGEPLDAARLAGLQAWATHPFDGNGQLLVNAVLEAASPLTRAPLLVQVAELEAQLAAAREAMGRATLLMDKGDGFGAYRLLCAALTGATQQ